MEGVECCSVEPHGLAIEQHKRVARAEQRLDDKWQQKSAATKNYWNTFFFFSYSYRLNKKKRSGGEKEKNGERRVRSKERNAFTDLFFIYFFFSCSSSFFLFRVQNIR